MSPDTVDLAMLAGFALGTWLTYLAEPLLDARCRNDACCVCRDAIARAR